MAGQNAAPLLKVEGLKQYFRVSKSYTVKAVDNVSFEIYPGETYGLVGESGSGKSTIGRSVIRLYDPTAGKITFDGQDISGRLNRVQNDTLRTQMQMIFQDPMASLNPRKKVEDIIGEGLDIHHMYKTPAERREKVQALMEQVGLNPSGIDRYPYGPEGVVGLKVKGRNSAGDVPAVSVTTNVPFDLTVTWGDGQSRTVRVEKSGSVKLN